MKIINNIINIKKIIISALISISAVFCLVGCDEVQIFEEKKDPTVLNAYSNKELISDRYYIKNGTKFYETLKPSGSASMISYVLNESRISPIAYESLIPTYYQDEILAYYSDTETIDELELERFKDLGYSIGIYNAIYNGTQIDFTRSDKNIVKGSTAYDIFNSLSSDTISIIAINGEPITKENFNIVGGVITGLEKNKEYTISYYEGTRYHEDKIIADTLMLQSYELYFSEDLRNTSNGYVEFEMPNDMQNGYYSVNGRGIFKFLNYKRGEQDDLIQDLNISYYKSEAEKLAAYSRQYSVNIPNRVKDLSIKVNYTDNSNYYTTDMIQGMVIAPDGTTYDMKVIPKTHNITLDLEEASAGKWIVNIVPKILYINDVKVDSNEIEEAYTLIEKEKTFTENQENVVFKIPVNKKGTVFGSIIAPDGSTYEFELIDEEVNNTKHNYYLYYEVPFVNTGTYKIKIYHDPIETSIGELEVFSNYVTETEVIIVEE